MDKYKQRQQQELAFRRTQLEDDGRRTKMRKEKETTESNYHNDSSGTNSNFTSSSLHKQLQPRRGGGEGSRGRSPRPGFEPQILYKTYAESPNLSSRRSVNTKKLVNWRLACFMSNEYLTRGTLLGRPWRPQDMNPSWHGVNDKSKATSASLDQDEGESRREKETLYHTLTDSLRAGDVHLPGIVNKSWRSGLGWINKISALLFVQLARTVVACSNLRQMTVMVVCFFIKVMFPDSGKSSSVAGFQWNDPDCSDVRIRDFFN